jgi:hypothetical protein
MADNGKPARRPARKLYWDRCNVCQYMKKNPVFRLRVMQSSYFNPEGTESLARVVHDFGDPVTTGAIYIHMQRHQANDLEIARRRYTGPRKLKVPDILLPATAVEGEVNSVAAHELGLDEFIKQGRAQLALKEMPLSATNFLQAIKIKSDIEKNTKDRRMEMIKAFFSGGGAKEEQSG